MDVRTRAEDLPLPRRVLAFAVLMVFEFCYGWCWNTVDVLRPQIRAALGLTLTEAGSAYTAQSIGALVGAVFLGQMADKFGRRRTLFAIVIGYGTMSAAGVLVGSYPMLLAQRFFLGFFLGGIFPVLIALYMGLFASHLRGKLAALGTGTYNLSIVALGWALTLPFAATDWRLIVLIGAVLAVVLFPLLWLVPDDRRMFSWGATDTPIATSKLPITELFSPALFRTTALLFVLVGFNFFAYQAFAGWVTTYLKEDRGFSTAVTGNIIALQFIGATLGGFFWGWFSDRYGRKTAATGFFIGALVVILYLTMLRSPQALTWAGFLWGFMITSSVVWAPWMSELYPSHLRSSAMSIFNWGRLISMTSPLITGTVADSFGLPAAMMLSAVGFGIAGVVWLLIPETIGPRARHRSV